MNIQHRYDITSNKRAQRNNEKTVIFLPGTAKRRAIQTYCIIGQNKDADNCGKRNEDPVDTWVLLTRIESHHVFLQIPVNDAEAKHDACKVMIICCVKERLFLKKYISK